jgi:Flp pilus assembly protein TadB
MAQTRFVLAVIVIGMVLAIASCESGDARLAEYARQSVEQQARQNETMARHSEQVVEQSAELAKTAQSLVEQDASARRQMIESHAKLQSELHVERQGLDSQRQELHADRKAVTAAMIREPVIGQAIITAGLILAALLPLLVTAYALRRLPNPGPSDQLLAETLIETFEADHQRLEEDSALAGSNPPRIEGPAAGQSSPMTDNPAA